MHLFPALHPLLLPCSRIVVPPRNRQATLLQLLLDDLPPADFGLPVDGGDLALVKTDVGELPEFAHAAQELCELGLLRRHGGQGLEVLDGLRGRQLRVGDEIAS